MYSRWGFPRKKRRPLRRALFMMLATAVALSALALALVDRTLVPAATEIVSVRLRNRINAAVNDSVRALVDEYALTSEDFYSRNTGVDGKIVSLEVNTVLVSLFCAQLSVDISDALSVGGIEDAELPLGALSGIRALANTGPGYTIRIMPEGEANVDYTSSFESAGINQINFKVWLEVESSFRIVNPLLDKSVTVTRTIPLVDTVFAGDIPEIYIEGVR